MVQHLIQTKNIPIGRGVAVSKPAQQFRPGLDAVNDKMNDKIQWGQPPKVWRHKKDYQKGQRRMNGTMSRKGANIARPALRLFQHVRNLQRKIRQIVFYLINDKQPKHLLQNHVQMIAFPRKFVQRKTPQKGASRPTSDSRGFIMGYFFAPF